MRVHSILFQKDPPRNKKLVGDLRLWWAVIRQSAYDIEYGYEQQALDAYEFLSSTGLWILIDHFNFTDENAVQAVAGLVRRYNARHKNPLPIRLESDRV